MDIYLKLEKSLEQRFVNFSLIQAQGELKHFLVWLFKNFFYVSWDLILTKAFWKTVWTQLISESKYTPMEEYFREYYLITETVEQCQLCLGKGKRASGTLRPRPRGLSPLRAAARQFPRMGGATQSAVSAAERGAVGARPALRSVWRSEPRERGGARAAAGGSGGGGAELHLAKTRAGAAPLGGRGAAATQVPSRDIGIGEAAATRDQQPRQTHKHVIGEVVATKITGTVKWYNVKNNYGFITGDDTGEDLFIHRTAIERNNPKNYLRSVGDGEVVEFDLVQGKKGLQATNVTGPGGIPVKGSRYAQNDKQYPSQQLPYPQPTFPFYPISSMNPFLSLPHPQFIPSPFFTPWLPYTIPFPYNSSPMPRGG
uniref:Uncharacterized protein n=1 Tax=Corvus moneduloides TaxID=1196302 RepID=A0A8U7P3E7_CORMO